MSVNNPTLEALVQDGNIAKVVIAVEPGMAPKIQARYFNEKDLVDMAASISAKTFRDVRHGLGIMPIWGVEFIDDDSWTVRYEIAEDGTETLSFERP